MTNQNRSLSGPNNVQSPIAQPPRGAHWLILMPTAVKVPWKFLKIITSASLLIHCVTKKSFLFMVATTNMGVWY